MFKVFLLIPIFFIFNVEAQFFNEKKLTHSALGIETIHAVDIDFDGDNDLIAESDENNQIFWIENMGNGEFSNDNYHSIQNPNNFFNTISSFDIDHDGDLEIITLSSYHNKICLFENLNNSTFGNQIVLNNQILGLSNCIIKDIDNDNLEDLIVLSNYQNTWKLYFFKNLNNLQFDNPIELYSQNVSLAGKQLFDVTDIEGDNDNDIIINSAGQIKILKNNGAGSFNFTQNIITNSYSLGLIQSVDIDNDGDKDILAIDSDGLFVVKNLGNSMFGTKSIIINQIQNIHKIDFKDVDNDGYNDIFLSLNSNNVSLNIDILCYRNIGGINFNQNVLITSDHEDLTDFIVTDIDDDNKVDVVTTTDYRGKIAWFKKNNDFSFRNESIISIGNYEVSANAIGDLNNDGYNDIVSYNQRTNSISYFENSGNGQFKLQKLICSCINYYEQFVRGNIYLSDLDKDGLLDIIFSYGYHSFSTGDTPNGVIWYKNNGDFNFTVNHIYSNDSNELLNDYFNDIKVLDFDNDGDNDIVYTFYNDGYIRLFKNNGNCTFNTNNQIAHLDDVYNVEIADINNDSFIDIFYKSATSLKYYLNTNGVLNYNNNMVINGLNNAYTYKLFDINNDNYIDILCIPIGTSSLSWLKNNSGLNFSQAQYISNIDGSLRNISISDINLDQKIDIIIDSDSGIFWKENIGNGNFEDNRLITNNADNFSELGDLDQDGDNDLLTSNLTWIKNGVISKNQIKGNLFIDINSNKIKDSLEVGISNFKVKSNPNFGATFSSNNGDFFLNFESQIGNYEIFPDSISHWSISSDSSKYHISISGIDTLITEKNFGFFPNDSVDEIVSTLTGQNPRCNSLSNYKINVKNIGSTHPSVSVNLEMDQKLNLYYSSLNPDSTSINHLFWTFDNLEFFSSKEISFLYEVPNYQFMGDTLINILTTKIDNQVFSDTLIQIISCAFDPNYKTVTPKGIDNNGFIDSDTEWLDYIIHFQNTGNDYAQNISITDVIDTNLEINSLTILDFSDSVSVSVNQHNEVNFKFNDIMLPDSNTNEPESHGFIRYKIKLKPNLESGTKITNMASIYFDYNPPILTNTTGNTLYDCNKLFTLSNFDSNICEYDFFETQIIPLNDVFNFNYSWDINDSIIVSNTFEWEANDLGVFPVYIYTNSNICHDSLFVFNLNIESCLSVDDINSYNFKIFPNPFSQNFYIKFPEENQYQLNFINTIGEIISSKIINIQDASIMQFNENLSNGVYFIEFINLETGFKTKEKLICNY